jgi:hypothetical protein
MGDIEENVILGWHGSDLHLGLPGRIVAPSTLQQG